MSTPIYHVEHAIAPTTTSRQLSVSNANTTANKTDGCMCLDSSTVAEFLKWARRQSH